MASYTEWNQAFVSYFISGVPRDTKVYLSVDEDLLEHIGRDFKPEPTDGRWSADFRAAVREEAIVEGRVN